MLGLGLGLRLGPGVWVLGILRLGSGYIVVTYIEVYIQHSHCSVFWVYGLSPSHPNLTLILMTLVFLDLGKITVTAVSVEYG